MPCFPAGQGFLFFHGPFLPPTINSKQFKILNTLWLNAKSVKACPMEDKFLANKNLIGTLYH